MRYFLTLLYIAVSVHLSAQTLPKDSGYISIPDAGTIYYEAYGKGTPVLLLHGHSLDRRMWRTQIAPLSKHFRVITPDLRGYGRSSRMRSNLCTTHVDDVIAFMDSLHISKAHVVGLSMGGFITADMVAMYPERMLSCVMASGTLRSVKGITEPIDSADIIQAEQKVRRNLEVGIGVVRAQWIDQLVVKGGSHAEAMRDEITRIINDWDCWQLCNVEPRLYYARQALPVLKSRCPKVPALYLSGETENKRRPGILDYLPNSEFYVIPDCGHMSNMERPDEFNKKLLEFLLKANN